jgi:hypothetical protein
MPISVSTSEQQIAATVTGDNSVTATVQAGFGATGPQGPAATITVGTVTAGAPGTSASVVNAGTSGAAVLNFTIPAGAVGATGPAGAAGTTGAKGDTGDPATIAVGTVTTGAPGTSASVVNAGTSGAAVLNFTIPAGSVGATGPAGAAGATGAKGDKGDTGSVGATGAKGDKGDTGSVGATGAKGDKGDKGDTGDPATLPSGTEGHVLTYVSGVWASAAPSGVFDQDLNTTDSVSFRSVVVDTSHTDPVMLVTARDPGDDSVLDTAYIGVRTSAAAAFVQSLNGWLRVEKGGGDIGGLVVETVRFADATEQTTAWTGLPTATSSVLGGVKIGSGVTITDGVISVSTSYAAASHTHAASDIASGTLDAARLPTVLERTVTVGNSGTSTTLSLANGSVQTVTLNGNCTFTMPAAAAGASLTLILTQGGTNTATFTGVLWPGGTAPTITATANKVDILVFVSNGTSWFGTASQNH